MAGLHTYSVPQKFSKDVSILLGSSSEYRHLYCFLFVLFSMYFSELFIVKLFDHPEQSLWLNTPAITKLVRLLVCIM